MENEEKFSEDPEQQLKMENELLKLKLKAQTGANFNINEANKLTPELENQFLKNILNFENNFQNAVYITIYERLGKPTFIPLKQLKAGEVNQALENITKLLEANNIHLEFLDGIYPDDVIYSFITDELFKEEISKEDNLGTHCFIYEEFHLNYKAEITKNTHQFLEHWFNREFNNYHIELARKIIMPKEIEITREEFIIKSNLFFESFRGFQNTAFQVNEIKYELSEGQTGFGNSEGILKYEAVLETGEIIIFEGPFKLYMSLEYNYWSIFSFVMPGFLWTWQ